MLSRNVLPKRPCLRGVNVVFFGSPHVAGKMIHVAPAMQRRIRCIRSVAPATVWLFSEPRSSRCANIDRPAVAVAEPELLSRRRYDSMASGSIMPGPVASAAPSSSCQTDRSQRVAHGLEGEQSIDIRDLALPLDESLNPHHLPGVHDVLWIKRAFHRAHQVLFDLGLIVLVLG
jgi:hypothetical protein